MHNLCEKRHERYMDKEGDEGHEERDDRDGEEAQPSAIILRNDPATYFAITELVFARFLEGILYLCR